MTATIRLRPAGLAVEACSNDPAPLAALERLFGPIESFDGGPELRLAIHVVGERAAADAPRPAVSFEVALPRLVCRLGSSSAEGDTDRGELTIRLGASELPWPDLVEKVLLATPVLCTLSRRHAVPFHAAGLVLDGRAVMVRAAADGGKSTLACAWALGGGRVMSDEVVFVSRSGPAILHGFGTEVEILPDAASFFGTASFEAVTTPNGEAKLRLALGPLGTRTAPLAAIVALDRAPGRRCSLEPLTTDETLAFFRATAVVEEGPEERQRARLGELLSSVPAFRLRTGGDPAAGKRAIEELLAGLPRTDRRDDRRVV